MEFMKLRLPDVISGNCWENLNCWYVRTATKFQKKRAGLSSTRKWFHLPG